MCTTDGVECFAEVNTKRDTAEEGLGSMARSAMVQGKLLSSPCLGLAYVPKCPIYCICSGPPRQIGLLVAL